MVEVCPGVGPLAFLKLVRSVFQTNRQRMMNGSATPATPGDRAGPGKHEADQDHQDDEPEPCQPALEALSEVLTNQ